MSDRFDLPTFASACGRPCWEEHKENPENRLIVFRAEPTDDAVLSMSVNRRANQARLNKSIQEFFEGTYRFGAMAQVFGWEERVAIGWVQRNIWLLSAVERTGPRLICAVYNDTDEPQAVVLEDPPMMGLDNAGLVRGWIDDGPFKPLAILTPNDPHAERLARQHVTDYTRHIAENN